MDPVSVVIALCMFVNGELKEHRIQDTTSDCLKHRRESMRQLQDKPHIDFRCGQVEAILESNVDGSKSIKKIIGPKE